MAVSLHVLSVCMDALAGSKLKTDRTEQSQFCYSIYVKCRVPFDWSDFTDALIFDTWGFSTRFSLDDFCHVHATYFTDLCEFGRFSFRTAFNILCCSVLLH